MKELEKQYKALANRKRLSIIKYLKQAREASVGDIADEIELTLKATSKHLGILAGADYVEKRKQSLLVFYRLTDKPSPIAKQLLSQI